MGGLAFASGPDALYTPRMPPKVYRYVREECQGKLRALFHRVQTPVEGPGKADFGDVDVMVAMDRQPGRTAQEALAVIKKTLGAVRERKEGKTRSFAVPWPEEVEQGDGSGLSNGGAQGDGGNRTSGNGTDEDLGLNSSRRRFVQVDVRICSNEAELDWMLFKHAHGDVWSLLGSIIRPHGLTIDEDALWLRIPEIETSNRNLSKIRLSDDPSEVLRFLGMAEDGYWEEPFKSYEELFEYTATCRLFWVKPPDSDHTTEEDQQNGKGRDHHKDGADDAKHLAGQKGVEDGGQEGGAPGKKQLTANDRKRMKQRPVFRIWHDEFVPRCRAEGRFPPPEPGMTNERMRDIVREEAFARYVGVREVYQERRLAFLKRQREDEVVRLAIKEGIPRKIVPGLEELDMVNIQHRQVLISALKKIVLFGDKSFGVEMPKECRDADNEDMLDVEAVRDWVKRTWHVLEKVTWQRQLQLGRENMATKEQKRKAAEEAAATEATQQSTTGSP